MNYAEWKKRTARGWSKPRSSLLRALDRAFENYEKNESAPNLKVLDKAFTAWITSKTGRTYSRNKDGAIDELNHMIEEAMKIAKISLVGRVGREQLKAHGGMNVFAEAAKKAREKTAGEDKNRHRVNVDVSQTITYTPGMNFQKWNNATNQWENYVVPGPASEDQNYGWKTKMDLILRGTTLEVVVHCAAADDLKVTQKIRNTWTTHILSGWNNRAKIVDNEKKKTYYIKFSLKWGAPGAHVYTIGLGNRPPSVQKTGAIFNLPSSPSAYIYLSELRHEALRAPDLTVFKNTRLNGEIGTVRYFKPTNTWKTTKTTAGNTPELADLLRSINSTAKYHVKSYKTGQPEGPYEVKSAKLRALAAAGFLGAKTPVKKVGTHQYVRAEQEADLRGFITPEKERKAWAQKLNTTVNTEVFGEFDTKAICHEFGHLIGNPDEYEVTSISASTGQVHDPTIHNAVRFTNNSVMNNPNIGFVEERHFYFILKQYRDWQASLSGKPVSAEIELNKVKINDPVASMTLNEVIALMLIRRRPPEDEEEEEEED